MAGPRVHCNICNTTIQSTFRHDFVTCNCPQSEDGNGSRIFIDGGDSYVRFGYEKNSSYTWVDIPDGASK